MPVALAVRDAAPRILIVGADLRRLSALDPAPAEILGLRVCVAHPRQPVSTPLPFPSRSVRQVPGLRSISPSGLLLAARATRAARREGVPAGWFRAVTGDMVLHASMRDVDVVVSIDDATDRALRHVPRIEGCTIVYSGERDALWQGLTALAEVLAVLDAVCRDRIADGRINPRPMEPQEVRRLAMRVDPGLARSVPPALLPADRAADTARRTASALGPVAGAALLRQVLGPFRWHESARSLTSGLQAQQLAARIWLARDEAQFPSLRERELAAHEALRGADAALDGGAEDVARDRLADAMTLIFHRELHADAPHSCLVDRPAEYLADLYGNRTFRTLVAGGRPPRLRRLPARGPDRRPRVLVLGGAYGDFHRPVVEALAAVAPVVLRRPRTVHRFFLRKGIDPQVLEALGVLRGTGRPRAGDPWCVEALTDDIRRTLLPRLRRADVVFSDWADRLTVWASHFVPHDCRLVVRIHSLDALHPSFHLVDWSAVDQVIVVSEPLRRLVEQLLAVGGFEVPVVVVPNIAALPDMARPKHPDARTTLGMVGWGRRVKDPLWALQLLEREPSWRLVLIGPDLPGRSASAQAYRAEVLSKISDPAMRDRVQVVGRTDEVAEHLRHVGVILSTSRRESWHLGLVEGAASGAVPVVRNWPVFASLGGARALFPTEWVVETVDEAEQRVRSVTRPEAWEKASREAQASALTLFDPDQVAQTYRDVVLGPLTPA